MLYLVALTFLLLVDNIQTICLAGQFWNPLNNACVTCNIFSYVRMPMERPKSLLRRFHYQRLRPDLSHNSQHVRQRSHSSLRRQ